MYDSWKKWFFSTLKIVWRQCFPSLCVLCPFIAQVHLLSLLVILLPLFHGPLVAHCDIVFGSLPLPGLTLCHKEGLCPDANWLRDWDFRTPDQRGEVKYRKAKRSYYEESGDELERKENGKDGLEKANNREWNGSVQCFPLSGEAFSVICRPVCGFWIHMMASLAPAQSGTLLMMFCNQFLY